jgi:hypothetical protein
MTTESDAIAEVLEWLAEAVTLRYNGRTFTAYAAEFYGQDELDLDSYVRPCPHPTLLAAVVETGRERERLDQLARQRRREHRRDGDR